MKRILIVITLIAAYTVAIANANTKVNTAIKTEVSVVADDFDNVVMSNEEDEKEKKDKKVEKKSCEKSEKACCGEKKADQKTMGCSEAQKKSCAASGKTCGGEKTTATKKCCGSKK